MIPYSSPSQPTELAVDRISHTRPALSEGAPLVVFVPGLGLNAASWDPVRRGLTGESRVLELPSLGLPVRRKTDLTVERQAERVLADLPGGRPIVLVGLSAGCPVIVEAAARCNRVVGLVLIGPVTDPRDQTWPRMLRQWARTAVHERSDEAASLLPQYWGTGAVSMLRGMNAVRRFRTDLALERLTVPVEVLRGENDLVATQGWSLALQSASQGWLTTVTGAAHMVPLTHPASVVAAVTRVRDAHLGAQRVPVNPSRGHGQEQDQR